MEKQCVLYDRICNNCGECNYCELDKTKICDNCGKCIESDSEYKAIKITKIKLDKNKKWLWF